MLALASSAVLPRPDDMGTHGSTVGAQPPVIGGELDHRVEVRVPAAGHALDVGAFPERVDG